MYSPEGEIKTEIGRISRIVELGIFSRIGTIARVNGGLGGGRTIDRPGRCDGDDYTDDSGASFKQA
jgi:hypothetical protein